MSRKHYSGKHYPSEMDKVIMEELDSFYDLCVVDIQEASDEAARWAAKRLRQISPRSNGPTSGSYASNWKVKRTKLRTGVHTVVFNEKLYMLTHLLEYGHPTGNGGRTQPHIHIKTVETEANQRFFDALQRRVENDA